MTSIEVDSEVFEELKKRAEPFVDKPNDVIRRILSLDGSKPTRNMARRSSFRRNQEKPSTERFIQQVLRTKFGESFRVISPYRTMFESPECVVYFQNFNSPGTSNLWYRLRGAALDKLVSCSQKSFVVFSNPGEQSAYVIPALEIERRAKRVGWSRSDLEVNIDPATHRWREMDWELSKYFAQIPGV